VPSHVIDVDGIRPLARSEALSVAGQEYERYLDLLRSLSDRDWRHETKCSPWMVQDMAALVMGQAESIGSRNEWHSPTRSSSWAKDSATAGRK
jgi:hypothetical protein